MFPYENAIINTIWKYFSEHVEVFEINIIDVKK